MLMYIYTERSQKICSIIATADANLTCNVSKSPSVSDDAFGVAKCKCSFTHIQFCHLSTMNAAVVQGAPLVKISPLKLVNQTGISGDTVP